jgi:sugar phosphate isomerase/epimerase
MLPIGLQLYTVRNQFAADYKDTLRKIAGIGYKGIEGGWTQEPGLIELLKQLDLKMISIHATLDQIQNQPEGLIEFAKAAGSGYIVLSWCAECKSGEYVIKEAAPLYNAFGRRCKDSGLQFCYHNHNHEFEKYKGEHALDLLMSHTDPELVQLELDTYWTVHAGVEVYGYLEKYKGRTPIVHLKDISGDGEKAFTEIGTGIIDFKRIAAIACGNGAQWLVAEQDQCRIPEFESIEISYNNLKKMGLIEK